MILVLCCYYLLFLFLVQGGLCALIPPVTTTCPHNDIPLCPIFGTLYMNQNSGNSRHLSHTQDVPLNDLEVGQRRSQPCISLGEAKAIQFYHYASFASSLTFKSFNKTNNAINVILLNHVLWFIGLWYTLDVNYCVCVAFHAAVYLSESFYARQNESLKCCRLSQAQMSWLWHRVSWFLSCHLRQVSHLRRNASVYTEKKVKRRRERSG